MYWAKLIQETIDADIEDVIITAVSSKRKKIPITIEEDYVQFGHRMFVSGALSKIITECGKYEIELVYQYDVINGAFNTIKNAKSEDTIKNCVRLIAQYAMNNDYFPKKIIKHSKKLYKQIALYLAQQGKIAIIAENAKYVYKSGILYDILHTKNINSRNFVKHAMYSELRTYIGKLFTKIKEDNLTNFIKLYVPMYAKPIAEYYNIASENKKNLLFDPRQIMEYDSMPVEFINKIF